MKVTYYFRRRIPSTHSIENVFERIAKQNGNNKLIYVPFESNRIIHILRNIVYSTKYQGSVNHITGDIHYAILGFRSKNWNILTIHDCGILFDKSKPVWKRLFIKYMWFILPVRKADIITTVSEKTRKEILQFAPYASDKIVVVPNYVNPDITFSERPFNTSVPRILHIGSTLNKNLSRVIEALEGLNCEFRIIGNVSATDRSKLESREINYTNAIDLTQDEIIREYYLADLVLFVSTYEGFGLPILEAQSAGRPVITSVISPCKEIAGEGAICVNPWNVQEIRSSIVEVIANDTLRKDSVLAGLENVKQYSFDSIQEMYSKIYALGKYKVCSK